MTPRRLVAGLLGRQKGAARRVRVPRAACPEFRKTPLGQVPVRGREIEQVETHTPGRLEFLATRTGERYRRMDGERIQVSYGAENRIHSFQAVGVTTLTEPERGARRKNAAPSKTWSQALHAEFDPASGELTKLRQWGDFRYEEGTQRAKAREAVLEQASGRITLEGGARSWDPTGSVLADRIVLDQNTGDFTAEGNVSFMACGSVE